MAAAGLVEGMPEPDVVERFFREPPDDTRAYLRAHVLRRFGEHVSDMDWDRVRFRLHPDRYWWKETALPMPDPAGYGRSVSEPVLARCETLTELLAALGIDAEATLYGRGDSHGSRGRGEAWGQSWDSYDTRPRRRSSTWW